MTKAQALSYITSTFDSLDDSSAAVLADFAESLVQPDVPLKLTAKDLKNIAKSREDFRLGRVYTSAEAQKITKAFLDALPA